MGFRNERKCRFALFDLKTNTEAGQWVGTWKCNVISMKQEAEMNVHDGERTSEDSHLLTAARGNVPIPTSLSGLLSMVLESWAWLNRIRDVAIQCHPQLSWRLNMYVVPMGEFGLTWWNIYPWRFWNHSTVVPRALHIDNIKSKMGTKFPPGGDRHLRKIRHGGTKLSSCCVWTSPEETWGCATEALWCCWPRRGLSAPSASWPSPWALTTGSTPEGCAAPRARTTTRRSARTRRCWPIRVCGGPAAPKVGRTIVARVTWEPVRTV